jgi:hypothetical protein
MINLFLNPAEQISKASTVLQLLSTANEVIYANSVSTISHSFAMELELLIERDKILYRKTSYKLQRD